MTTTGMDELLEFEEWFMNYSLEWMMREPGRYSKVLIRVFYTAYKGEL